MEVGSGCAPEIGEDMMMNVKAVFSLVLLVGMQGTFAQSFVVKAGYGDVQVFQGIAGTRAKVSDSATITMGDSLIVGIASQAVVNFETNTRLRFKGPGALTITGDSSTAYLSFDQGQLFLDRVEPTIFSVLTFWLKNYMFVPSGTAAAFRVMNNGTPAVMVMEGRILMQSPTGESIEVQPGKFGYVDASGRIGTGILGKKIIAALEQWSNMKMGQSKPEAKNSSPDIIDDEFIAVMDELPAPAKLAVAPKSAGAGIKKQEQSRPVVAIPAPGTPAPVSGTAATDSPEPRKEKTAAASKPKTNSKQGADAAPEAPEQKAAAPEKPTWEISAGSATVEDEQWTRLCIGVDVPIWKFGVFFDVEAFIDPSGTFSDKGWRFNDDVEYMEAFTRKIRYIRFGHEQDPLFVKVGGISKVTLGYGFIVDRFTNMLHYPDQKLLGGQLNLNNITPVGLTLQAFGADAQEARTIDHGGLGAARLALCPLKTLDIPIVSGISIGGTFAYDRNLYAPARKWKQTRDEKLIGAFDDLGILTDTVKQALRDAGYDPDGVLSQIAAENRARTRNESFGIFGGDISVPIIATSLLSLDVYAQAGMRNDSLHGWGVGAPGVALKVWRLSANVEYRHVDGRFMPGFFGPYYLDERLIREPTIHTKVDSLPDDTLNGAFGRLSLDLFGALTIGGGYQNMIGSQGSGSDQRIELSGELGPMITGRIPKVKSAEAYLYKTRIGADIVKFDTTGAPLLRSGEPVYDGFFDKTPFMYFGYRIGIGISEGATLIVDSRYGWLRDSRGRLTPNNNISIETAFTF
jgi:hypothetical protein